jgi:hypothetical protein
MSLLLPQERACAVLDARTVEIHGDRYVDVVLRLDDPGGSIVRGRVSATDCPSDLATGDRVSAHFVMGVITRIQRLDSR